MIYQIRYRIYPGLKYTTIPDSDTIFGAIIYNAEPELREKVKEAIVSQPVIKANNIYFIENIGYIKYKILKVIKKKEREDILKKVKRKRLIDKDSVLKFLDIKLPENELPENLFSLEIRNQAEIKVVLDRVTNRTNVFRIQNFIYSSISKLDLTSQEYVKETIEEEFIKDCELIFLIKTECKKSELEPVLKRIRYFGGERSIGKNMYEFIDIKEIVDNGIKEMFKKLYSERIIASVYIPDNGEENKLEYSEIKFKKRFCGGKYFDIILYNAYSKVSDIVHGRIINLKDRGAPEDNLINGRCFWYED